MAIFIFKLTPGLGYINKTKSNNFHTVPKDGIALQTSFVQNALTKKQSSASETERFSGCAVKPGDRTV